MSHDEDLYAPLADDNGCPGLPLWARDEEDSEDDDESEDE